MQYAGSYVARFWHAIFEGVTRRCTAGRPLAWAAELNLRLRYMQTAAMAGFPSPMREIMPATERCILAKSSVKAAMASAFLDILD